MKDTNIIFEIRQKIKRLAKNPNNLKDYSRFHKDGKKHICLASKITKKLYSEEFRKVKHLDKKQIFNLCEKLLEYSDSSCRGMAFDWAFRIRKQYAKEDCQKEADHHRSKTNGMLASLGSASLDSQKFHQKRQDY